TQLQFRDVHGVDADTAYALTIGTGPESRVFRTTDGGVSWAQAWENPDTAAFYDCFDFWNAERGLMIGDEVNGEIMMLETHDGARHWTPVRAASLPPALAGEGSFASSGTCLVTRPGGHAWVSTTKGRVLHTADYGRTWTVSVTPTTVTDSTGVPSVSFRDDLHGMAFGGYGARPTDILVAVTDDGGATWTVRTRTPMRGGIWGGSYVPGTTGSVAAVGATGAAYSLDDGRSWTQLDTLDYWGIGFASRDAGWIVGRGGRIVKLSGF
ncbi:MAG: oxidoreductase, partial [Gemmatimonadota bacterium]